MPGFRRSLILVAGLVASIVSIGKAESAETLLPVLDRNRVPHEPRGGFNPAGRLRVFPHQGRLVYFETDVVFPGVSMAPLLQRIYAAPASGAGQEPGGFGEGWKTIYERRLRMAGEKDAALTDEWGRTIGFRKTGSGQFEAIEGSPRRLSESSGGWLLQQGDGLVWRFEKRGWCAGISDRRGGELVVDRDTDRPEIVKSVRDGHGNAMNFQWNGEALVTRIECSDGRAVDYEYEGNRLVSVRPAGKPPVRYAYDAEGRLSAVTYPGGLAIETRFDDRNGDLRQFAAAGVSRRYMPLLKPDGGGVEGFERTDDLGGRVRWSLRDRAVEIANEGGLKLRVEQNDRRLPTRLAIEKAGAWLWNYDESGRLVEARNPANESIRLAYEKGGLRPTLVEHPDGRLLRLAYDEKERPAAISRGSLSPWRIEYDDSGRIAGFEDYHRVRYKLGYDENGRIVSVSDSLGPDFAIDRDKFGRIVSIGRAGGPVIHLQRDAEGRVTLAHDGVESVRFEYTPSGNVALVAGSRGFSRRFYYTAAGLVAVVQYPGGQLHRLSYNAENHCIGIRRANGSSVNLSRGRGDRIEILEAGKEDRWTVSYDPAGRPQSLGKAGYERFGTDSDAMGRFRGTTSDAGPAPAVAYAGGSTIEEIETTERRLRFGYDSAGRLQSIAERNTGRRSAFEYDGNNRLVRHGKPGWNEQYRYHPDGTLESLAIDEPAPIIYRFEYDDHRRLLGIRYPNGVQTRFEYDPGFRLARVRTRDAAGKTLVVMDADYETSSRMVQATGLGTDRFEYRYDANLELAEVVRPNGQRDTWRRDAIGNPLVVNEDGRREVFQYGPDGRPTAIGQRRYVYERAGRAARPTDPDTVVLGQDDWNRVVELFAADGVTARYAYLPDGRLIRREINDRTLVYGWDGQRLRSVREGNGRTLLAFHYEPQFGLLLAVVLEGRMLYCHPDVFGLPYWLTDEEGDTVKVPEGFPIAVGNQTAPSLGPTRTGLPPAVRLPEEDLLLSHGRLCDPRSGNSLSPDLGRFLVRPNPYSRRAIPRPLEPVVAWRELENLLQWIGEIERSRLETGHNRGGTESIPLHRAAELIRAPETLEDDLLDEAFNHDHEVERWPASADGPGEEGFRAGLPMSALEPPASPADDCFDFSPLGPIPYDWSNDLERLIPGTSAELLR